MMQSLQGQNNKILSTNGMKHQYWQTEADLCWLSNNALLQSFIIDISLLMCKEQVHKLCNGPIGLQSKHQLKSFSIPPIFPS